nr:magnesium transporter [uncultured Pseudomonas sp.]
MKRHYYISDDLDELEVLEDELETDGISTEQIHVLSERDADVQQHRLNDVASLMKQDIVHSGIVGMVVGVLLALLVLGGAYLLGWTDSPAGWAPVGFLAIVIMGFCMWEGGFFGIQVQNSQFRRFKQRLEEGKHVFFVDVEPEQETRLEQAVRRHPKLIVAGVDPSAPSMAVNLLQRFNRFRRAI